jgi:hypothetical protein
MKISYDKELVMLSVRLPRHLEDELAACSSARGVTKSHIVQEALGKYLGEVRAAAPPKAAPEPDLSFLAPDDPIRAFIGICKDGMSTDELMRMTRGDDWNQP